MIDYSTLIIEHVIAKGLSVNYTYVCYSRVNSYVYVCKYCKYL